MTTEDYEQLTGTEVPTARRAAMNAALSAVQSQLEDQLGYSLSPADDPNPDPDADTDDGDVEDAVTGTWRTFPVTGTGAVAIDPHRSVAAVRIALGLVSEDVQAFESTGQRWNGYTNRLFFDRSSLLATCRDPQLSLSVKADWLGAGEVPDDLRLLWARAAAFEVDDSKNIRSESIGSRSYTRDVAVSPLVAAAGQSLLRRYAGPRGRATRVPGL